MHDVIGGFQAGVDPPSPRGSALWKLEFVRLPVCVEGEIDEQPVLAKFSTEGNRVGAIAPVGLIGLDAVPGFGGLAKHIGQPDSVRFVGHVAGRALLA